MRDFFLDVSRGVIVGAKTVNKFGRNPDVDTGTVPEDIWDGAGATPVWVPPTQARIHDIASTSANDAAAGTGARTVRVNGLTSWDKPEVSEDVTLNGTSNVATTNAYVIIHRMKCLTFGSGETNAGNITATAQSDGSVTAQITAGFGQTLMAIYGIPSVQELYICQWYMDMNAVAAASNGAGMSLLVNERADQSDSGFLVKHFLGLYASGSSHIGHSFIPPFKVAGPAIVKAQANTVTANNTDLSAGFDGVLYAYSHSPV